MKIAVAGGTGTVGRYVVASAHEHHHDVSALARSTGVDLLTGVGLADKLQGVDVVIDVTSVQTQSAKTSEQFFGTVTKHLLAAEAAAGVRHHVVLSVVGSDKAPYGYYAGKALQERLVSEGSIPWTILRATQFHEFAAQMMSQARIGPVNLVPRMVSQPVAASEVAERLVLLAESQPAGRATDLAGPEVLAMADMVRRYARAVNDRATIVAVPLPGGFGRALRNGTVLGDAWADRGTQTFSQWVDALRQGEGGAPVTS